MYKLKIKQGEKVTLRKRGNLIATLVGGETYTQEQLETLYNAGHKSIITKVKDKPVKDGKGAVKEKETTPDKDI